MLSALLYKELRETLGIAVAALVVYALFVSYVGGGASFPFVEDSFLGLFCFYAAGLAIWLGLRQTVTESSRGTWLFLLHRPIAQRQLIGAKLAVGAVLYLVCAALPILVYAFWAATPGNHASPFYGWMTASAWKAWSVIVLIYLGAFLSGIRPGRWVGTRLLPLVGTVMLTSFIGLFPWWRLFGLPALIFFGASLMGLIFFVAQTRDF
jgi:hypothetical protein